MRHDDQILAPRGDNQLFLSFLAPTILPRGDGTYLVQPGKPAAECDSNEAARILGCSRSSISLMLDNPSAQAHIKWRWVTPKRGKRLFEVASLYDYIRATRDPEFGQRATSLGA